MRTQEETQLRGRGGWRAPHPPPSGAQACLRGHGCLRFPPRGCGAVMSRPPELVHAGPARLCVLQGLQEMEGPKRTAGDIAPPWDTESRSMAALISSQEYPLFVSKSKVDTFTPWRGIPEEGDPTCVQNEPELCSTGRITHVTGRRGRPELKGTRPTPPRPPWCPGGGCACCDGPGGSPCPSQCFEALRAIAGSPRLHARALGAFVSRTDQWAGVSASTSQGDTRTDESPTEGSWVSGRTMAPNSCPDSWGTRTILPDMRTPKSCGPPGHPRLPSPSAACSHAGPSDRRAAGDRILRRVPLGLRPGDPVPDTSRQDPPMWPQPFSHSRQTPFPRVTCLGWPLAMGDQVPQGDTAP